MSRLRLYVSGVKVPKLGSVQDSVLQQFAIKELQQELFKTKLQAYIATSLSSHSKEMAADVTKIWNQYFAALTGEVGIVSDQDMFKEYELFKKILPKIKAKKKTKKGEVTEFSITGFEKFINKNK